MEFENDIDVGQDDYVHSDDSEASSEDGAVAELCNVDDDVPAAGTSIIDIEGNCPSFNEDVDSIGSPVAKAGSLAYRMDHFDQGHSKILESVPDGDL